MKGLLSICVLAVALTLTAAFPKYKIYKNQGRSTGTVASPSNSDGDVAAIFSRVEPTTAPPPTTPPPSPSPDTVSKVEPVVDAAQEVTSKSKLGDKPAGEPAKVQGIPEPTPPVVPAFPPAIPDAEGVPAVPASEPSPAPVLDATTPKATSGPAATPAKVTNGTSSSEEDDSSSEEAEEDEDDEGRRLIPGRRKAKSYPVKLPQYNVKTGKAGLPKNPPLKYDLVVNGFVTEDGQVLVPFDTYQKYFHNAESKALPPVYAITRDETQAPSTSAVVSEESDKSSEERPPALYSEKTKPETQAETDSSEAPVQGSGSSEEGDKEPVAASTSSAESEEKVAPSSESEKPVVVSNEVRPVPGPAQTFRPPLQALPARLPTDEDDEEEAGRYLDQYGVYPQFDYADDEDFHAGPPSHHKSLYYDY